MRSTLSVCAGIVALLALSRLGQAGTPVDGSNFAETVYCSSGELAQATSMAWAPDGRLFILKQHGEIKTIRNGAVVATFATFGVGDASGYAGALGICVDRNYASNKFVYVLATVANNNSQILRWTASGDVGTSKTTILAGLPTRLIQHDGGGIEMGPDGKIYFGMGDLGTGLGVDGDLNSLGSKVGRCNADGSAPTDNPYYNAGDGITHKDYIWARGFRNAFGLTFRPSNNTLWVSVVGTNYEQVFLVNKGEHAGWDNYEGGNQPAGYIKPKISYPTNGTGGIFAGAGCIAGGVFYTGASFPTAYRNNFFWGDYNSNKIYHTRLDAANNVLGHETFVTGASGFVDISQGPDGALYYVGFVGGGTGTVRRIQYRGAAVQDLVVSTSTMTITEGGSGTFTVRLAVAPPSNVMVTVGRSVGDSDVTPSPTSLTFTPSNWSTPQTVTVSAAQDADTSNDSATIACSSTGVATKNVGVTVNDNDTANGAPRASITKPLNGDAVTGTTAEFFGDGQDDVGCVKAEFYVDNVLRYTDVNSQNHYHYGGAHNRWDTTSISNGTHTLKMVVYDAQGLSGSHQITVTVSNGPSGTGTGLKGEYFDNQDLTALKVTRTDATVNFNWGSGSPDASVGPDSFSCRWTGEVQPRYTQPYTFYANTNDGVRLWVNNQLIIDSWGDGLIERTGTIALTANQRYALKMEHYEGAGTAVAQLSWSSSSQPKEIIPQSQLYPAAGPPPPPPPPPGPVPTAGLAFWVKADAGVTLNGSTVSQWSDQSGNGRHATQGTAANQPTLVSNAINGKPALQFDGAGDHLGFNLPINGSTGLTLILVSACTVDRDGGANGGIHSPLFWEETAMWGWTFLSPFQTGIKFRFGTTQTGNLPAYTRPASIGSGFSTTISKHAGATDSLYVNGTLVLSQGGKLSPISGTVNTPWIGRGASNTYFSGRIAEVMVYTRAITDSERQSIQQYLDGKYVAAPPPTGGTGLRGEYYDNENFTTLKVTRTDATVNFNWGSGSPHASVAADSFSCRWTGEVQPRYSQAYTFHANANDGVRLWVNNQMIIDSWTSGSSERSGTIALTANQRYAIRMEHFEGAGTAVAQLSWSSSSQAKEIIPQSRLYPAAAGSAAPMAVKAASDFATVQEAIDSAVPGDTVVLSPMRYFVAGGIVLKPGVTIRGAAPHETILDGQGAGIVVHLVGGSIEGLTVTGGVVGIHVGDDAYLKNLQVVRNTGDGILVDASVIVEGVSLTVADNGGDGIVLLTKEASFRNLVVTGNGGFGIDGPSEASVSFSNFFGNTLGTATGGINAEGYGNTLLPAVYASPADLDYREQAGSATIDSGDPADASDLEPSPNGGRINQGAFGNTPDAAPSSGGDSSGGSSGSEGLCGLLGLEALLVLGLALRRKMAAMLTVLMLCVPVSAGEEHKTEVLIRGEQFLINGMPTYEGRIWNGKKIEGLLFNARVVQGTFDDLNPETRKFWVYPDTGAWDPDRNTREFCEAMGEWRRHGLLAVTVNLQGGMPRPSTETKQPWHNSGVTEAGELRKEYFERLDRILRRADDLGMAVILGIFYFGQDERMKDEAAILRAVDQTVDWVLDRGYRNVLLEINNECDVYYEHAILKPERVYELITRARSRERSGRRLLVSTSFAGGRLPAENVLRAADFVLIHGNGVRPPEKLAAMVRKVRAHPAWRPMPVVFNEDSNEGGLQGNLGAAIGEYASWGYYDQGKNNYRDGFQSPPVDWRLQSDPKRVFFRAVKEVTGE